MALSGKNNRKLQGPGQLENIRRESIVDGEITAAKLNADVVGSGLRLNPITNSIELEAFVSVNTSSGLIEAITSGSMYIFLADGTYDIPQITVQSGTLQLTGQSKHGVQIVLSPSGTINVNHVSGVILSGSAAINQSNPGIVVISGGNVSGNAPLLSWENSYIVLDDIPYSVLRISSGEISGIAELELVEPWTQATFASKPFKLMYLVEDFLLRNLTIRSASESGVVDVERAINAAIENVRIQGLDVTNRETSGLRLKKTYQSIFSAVEILHTRSDVQEQYAIILDDVHYSNFYNMNLFNVNSSAICVSGSSYNSFVESRFVNINENLLYVIASNNIDFSENIFSNVFGGSTIVDSENIYIDSNRFESSSAGKVIDINSSDRVFIHANTFNATSSNQIIHSRNNSQAFFTRNHVRNGQSGIVADASGSIVVSDNQFFNVSNGVFFDSTINESAIDNNIIDAVSGAINVTGIGNYIAGNSVLNGSVVVASGNTFSVVATIEPQTGSTDLGTQFKPFRDLYLSGEIYGAQALFLSGNQITSASGTIYVNGIPVSGSGGGSGTTIIQGGGSGDIDSYVHVQSTLATTWTINHNRGSDNFVITTFDASGNVYLPLNIKANTTNQIVVENSFARSGKATIIFVSGTANGTANAYQYNHEQPSGALTWSINHGLGTERLLIQTFNSSGEFYIPNTITIVDSDNVEVVNSFPTSGFAVILTANLI